MHDRPYGKTITQEGRHYNVGRALEEKKSLDKSKEAKIMENCLGIRCTVSHPSKMIKS